MKNIVKILPILFVSLGVSACENTPAEEPKVGKTELKYTYRDVCDNYYRTSSSIPNSGEPKLLILPVYFSDSESYIPESKKEVVKNDIEKAFFGTKEELGNDSVSSYYSTLSRSKCKLTGTVANWIDVEDSTVAYYVDEEATANFCKNLVETYFSTSNDVRATYDTDNDGYLDGVVFIYAAPDKDNMGRNSICSNLWAYTNWIYNAKKDTESPNICNFMWASYDFMYSRTTASEKVGTIYGSGDTSNCSLDAHIYTHEIGHMFGLLDYYDYSGKFSPAGGFSMQDNNVGGHDPYSVLALGWTNPYIPTETCTITLNPFQSSGDCVILSNKWNDINSPFDEYILVEFYTPDGLNEFDHAHQYRGSYPKGADDSGLRIWHVDARLSYGSLSDPSKFTCDPTIETSKVKHMMSNTYADSEKRDYMTSLGTAYANYNLLQLIRNEEVETYKPPVGHKLSNISLFKNGSKFSMNKFGKQFVNQAKLNQNITLGWNFTVEIADNQAKISLTRTL